MKVSLKKSAYQNETGYYNFFHILCIWWCFTKGNFVLLLSVFIFNSFDVNISLIMNNSLTFRNLDFDVQCTVPNRPTSSQILHQENSLIIPISLHNSKKCIVLLQRRKKNSNKLRRNQMMLKTKEIKHFQGGKSIFSRRVSECLFLLIYEYSKLIVRKPSE